jgi:N-acyl-D-glutamate deacylase
MNTYDIAIVNGRVIDPETGLDAVRNVGIQGETIAVVTEEAIEGKETIDASGHVVCPGFIDMHQHNAGYPFGQKLALRDGVTTAMELELGVHPVKEWYEGLEGRSRTNYGASIGSIPIRETILNPDLKESFHGYFLLDIIKDPAASHTTMKWSKDHLTTAAQFERFEQMLEEGLQQGSVGVGHAAGYMVNGCSQQEAAVVQKMAGKYGQSSYVHARFSGQMPPTSGLLAFFEMMAPQEVYGGGIVFQHMSAQALRDTMTALELFDAASEKGIQVIGELYPYDYGASIVGADYLVPENYGPNMGRDYKDIIVISNLEKLTKERYDEIMKTNPMTPCMFYNAVEEDVVKGLEHPSSVVGSDAYIWTDRKTGEMAYDWDTPYDSVNGHPRGAGTHARVLAWTREKKLDIPLPLAVSKMTYMIARYMEDNGVPQMADKGRLQEGKDADITIFDPATVQDNATIQDGGLPSSGIPYVLVNGTVMVRDSETVDDAFPGKPVHGTGKVA